METKGLLGKHGLRRQNNKAPEKVREARTSRLVSSQTLIDRLGIRRYVKDKVERRYMDFSPETVYVAMKQHVGKPASPVVSVGDKVSAGTVIAKTAYEDLGTTMHSSIDGTVTEVTDAYIAISR